MKEIRWPVLVVWMTALALLMVGCVPPATTPTPTKTVPERQPTMAPAPVKSSPRQVAAAFEADPCPLDLPQGAVEGENLFCGYVTVPEQHAKPAGRTIRLAVAVIKSASLNPYPDPLVMLAGGPGQSALASFIPLLFAPGFEGFYAQRYIVLVEQRGTAYSTPFLFCDEILAYKLEMLDQDLSYEERRPARLEALVACRDRFAQEGINLAAYNSLENAADVILVVDALGYSQINLYGGSYGSLLAQHIMRDYPGRLRSVILDAVSPLRHEPNLLYKAHSFDRALRLLFAACAADSTCDEAYPELERVFFETAGRLDQNPAVLQLEDPATGERYDMLLTGEGLVALIRNLLYNTSLLPDLPKLFYDAAAGDYVFLQRFASILLFQRDLADGMYHSVLCTELANFDREDLADTAGLYPEVSRVVESMVWEVMLDPCEVWGGELLSGAMTGSVAGDVPALLLSGELDPTVPPHLADVAAERLENAYLYTFPGVAHSAMTAGGCPISVMLDFLDNPGQAPQAGCIDLMPGIVFNVPNSMEVVLEPFSREDLGFRGVMPIGWTEVAPGFWARAASAIDQTALIQDAAPGQTRAVFWEDFGAALGLETPAEAADVYESDTLSWELYQFDLDVQGIELVVMMALAEDEAGAYMVALIAAPEEAETLYGQVFLTSVEALVPIH